MYKSYKDEIAHHGNIREIISQCKGLQYYVLTVEFKFTIQCYKEQYAFIDMDISCC
jgi:hypothetical protein